MVSLPVFRWKHGGNEGPREKLGQSRASFQRNSEGGFCREAKAVCGGTEGWDLEASRSRSSGDGSDPEAGISEQTFYRWKKQYVGLEVDQVRQMKQLHEENTRLKHLVAELSLDKVMLQDVLRKKF